MKSLFCFLFSALATALCSTVANADTTWDFSYSGTGVFGSGQFVTGDDGAARLVTGISGVANGFAITGLSSYATANNILYVAGIADGIPVDSQGIAFSTASGITYALYYFGGTLHPGGYLQMDNTVDDPDGIGLNSVEITALSIQAVPEPETYAMMLIGLGLLSYCTRRGRQHQS
jgi:hypothetical protein